MLSVAMVLAEGWSIAAVAPFSLGSAGALQDRNMRKMLMSFMIVWLCDVAGYTLLVICYSVVTLGNQETTSVTTLITNNQ